MSSTIIVSSIVLLHLTIPIANLEMEPEVQYCSSEDDNASDGDESLCEEEVEEDGCQEMILVPKKDVSP